MGEVYQATDTNLARQVAIKVLPASVASDPERLARFDREAKTLAALNHPNIAQIHGLEKSAGTIALVMELVEGPTLADRIAQGAIPVDEALPIARQIAEALEAAHEQGIIHRDLKPANIKVRPDGTVKVLDFGLAKAMEPTGAMSPEMSQAPTITTPAMTQAGMILGTAAYMSPEQAKSRTVDKRSDIWAFGAVLYEMLSGQRAFGGEDISDTLANVLKTEPDWEGLSPEVPARVRQVLRACLQKNAKQRFGDVQDVRLALEGAFETGVSSSKPTAVHAAPPSKLPWVAAIVLAVLLTGLGAWVFMQPDPEPPQPVRLTAVHPGTEVVGLSLDTDVVLSPDGRRVVYATGGAAEGPIYVRALDQLEPTLLVEAGRSLSLSPDGQWVGFASGAMLSKVAINGGPTVPIGPTRGAARGTGWVANDTIVFATNNPATGLSRVSAAGGEPEVLTTPVTRKLSGSTTSCVTRAPASPLSLTTGARIFRRGHLMAPVWPSAPPSPGSAPMGSGPSKGSTTRREGGSRRRSRLTARRSCLRSGGLLAADSGWGC